jgi:hypothetical protein
MVFKVSLKDTAVRLLRSPLVGSSRRSLLTKISSSFSVHHLLVPSLRLKAEAGWVIDGDMMKKATMSMRTQIMPSRRNLLRCQLLSTNRVDSWVHTAIAIHPSSLCLSSSEYLQPGDCPRLASRGCLYRTSSCGSIARWTCKSTTNRGSGRRLAKLRTGLHCYPRAHHFGDEATLSQSLECPQQPETPTRIHACLSHRDSTP